MFSLAHDFLSKLGPVSGLVGQHSDSRWIQWVSVKAKLSLATLVFLVATASVRGQSIWSNPISSSTASNFNPYTTDDSYDPNITVSGIGRGTGITGNAGGGGVYDAFGWTSSASPDPDDYYSFTLTPNTGRKISFNSFIYTGKANVSGAPNAFAFRSSLDAFTANIGTANENGTTLALSAAAYQNVVAPITFRFYAFNASNAAARFAILDFDFTGAVTALGGTANYFDINGATAESGVANATYDFANAFWSTNSAGTAATTAFSSNATPTFSAGTDAADNTYTVNTAVVVNVGGISFEEGNVTLSRTGTGAYNLTDSTINVASGGTATISAPVSGSVGLSKSGQGLLRLSGVNTYTGATVVGQGSLIVNGSMGSAASTVTVGGGAILGGTGTISGATTVNGSLLPGDAGVGTLTFNNALTLGDGSTSVFQFSTLSSFDKVAASTVTLSGTSILTLDFTGYTGGPLAIGNAFKILDATTAAITGNFSGAANGSTFTTTIGGLPYTFEYVYDGASINGFFTSADTSALYLVVVPEPSQTLLLLTGAVLLSGRRRRTLASAARV